MRFIPGSTTLYSQNTCPTTLYKLLLCPNAAILRGLQMERVLNCAPQHRLLLAAPTARCRRVSRSDPKTAEEPAQCRLRIRTGRRGVVNTRNLTGAHRNVSCPFRIHEREAATGRRGAEVQSQTDQVEQIEGRHNMKGARRSPSPSLECEAGGQQKLREETCI